MDTPVGRNFDTIRSDLGAISGAAAVLNGHLSVHEKGASSLEKIGGDTTIHHVGVKPDGNS